MSVLDFFEFVELFLIFFNFFKTIKNLSCVKLTSCHVAVTVWCDNESTTCHYYVRYHFLTPNLVPIFLLLSRFSPNFCKIVQFRLSPNWNKNYFLYKCYKFFLLNLIFLFKLIFLLYILTKLRLFKFVFHIQFYLKLFSNFKFICFRLLHKLVKIIF